MDYFNFCHSRLNPSVTSSAVSAESHEVTNLISDDISKKQKGFMVYRTINPPVDVTFTFMCKINVSHIIIWPQVGNQKSSGFQIFTSTGRQGVPHSNQAFVNVGAGYLQNEPGIVFHHVYEPTNSSISSFLRRKLSTRQNSLSAVNAVQIRIMKTHQSSVPAILKVEVWGLPSVSCPKEVRMKVLDLWSQKDKKAEVPRIEKKIEDCVLRSTAKALVSSDFEIPEDFLDPITCEIMVLPFILPSGKIVDQRTLEKHENHEANWGRRPNDPFTGKLYTETSKPVLAVALKARIDKFLIDHADMEELKKVPRTVGRKTSTSSSKEAHAIVKKEKRNLEMPILQTDAVKSSFMKNSAVGEIKQQQVAVDKFKRKYEVSDTDCKKRKIEAAASTSCEPSQSNSGSEGAVRYSESCLKRSHEDVLNDSLNAALKSALSGLPSFTNFSPKIQEIENKCSECSDTEVLYILPCKHFLCRTCLTKKTSDKSCNCPCCNLTFNSSDPKRFFP